MLTAVDICVDVTDKRDSMEYLHWCQKRRDPSYYGPKWYVRHAAISVHTYMYTLH